MVDSKLKQYIVNVNTENYTFWYEMRIPRKANIVIM